MIDPDLFTVKVFKVLNNGTPEGSNSPDQERSNHQNFLNGFQLIEEHHNMTSARVIRVSFDEHL